MERFECGLEIKALTEEGQIDGYGAIFGNVDRGGDKIVAGAFSAGLEQARKSGRSIKMLWQHDPREPIGVWDEVTEEAKGLRVKGRLVLDVPRAREVHALLKAGAIGGLSIGYRTTSDQMEGDVRLIKAADLFEVSAVTFPMNEKAKVVAVKGEGLDGIVEKLKAGDRLTEREFETMAKGLGLSNSQAERAARIHLKGPGEPAKAASEAQEFFRAMLGR